MNINEILRDLNVTIADVELTLIELGTPRNTVDFKRALGQLRAARASLYRIRTQNTQKEVNYGPQ
jgi:hypothetical protein